MFCRVALPISYSRSIHAYQIAHHVAGLTKAEYDPRSPNPKSNEKHDVSHDDLILLFIVIYQNTLLFIRTDYARSKHKQINWKVNSVKGLRT